MRHIQNETMCWLHPWCTKDPRSCAKYFGFLDMMLSVSGVIILFCLPFLILKVEEEVIYIHGSGQTSSSASNTNNRRNYTLNITNTYDTDCNEIVKLLIEHLQRYLEKVDTVSYTVSLNKSKLITSRTKRFCEIHILTNVHPINKKIIYKNETVKVQFTIAEVAAKAIMQYNTHQSIDEIKNMMSLLGSNNDEIAVQYIYPEGVGTDPERRRCIEVHMAKARKEDVKDDYDFVHNMLMISGCLSIVCSLLVISTEYKVSKCLLCCTLLMEFVSIIPLLLAILFVNRPSLCLLQYRGISDGGYNSPGYLVTIITYTCIVYIATKFYCMWFLAAYAIVANKIRESMMAAYDSNIELTKSEEEMEKAERLKTINRLLKRDDEGGGSIMSDESPMSSDEDIGKRKWDK